MVLRSLVKLTGCPPLPNPEYIMPRLRRVERKGQYSFQLLFGANFVGGVLCTLFVMRYLSVKDRGLSPHFKRNELDEPNGPWIQLVSYDFGAEYKTPDKPDIKVFQPILETVRATDDGSAAHHH